uniref:Uncharacterized protein n=1 Tax=viral metagenome TaxID=1070528 RepID=A0A6C0KXB1_9ZZZZ
MYTYKVDPNKINTGFKEYSHFLITIRGVFLALILFCASFLAPYIGCNYQTKLKTSMTMRYLLLFLVIYFSINLVDSDIDGVENPLFSIVKSAFVFFIFLLLNAIESSSIIITLVLFTLLIISSKYYSYFKNSTHNPDETVLTLFTVVQIILAFSIIVLLVISTVFSKNKKSFSDYFYLNRCAKSSLEFKRK